MSAERDRGRDGFRTGLPADGEYPRRDFVHVDTPNPHALRAREILRAHPEVRELFGPDARTALHGAGLVCGQLGLAAWLDGAPLWVVVVLAYLVGAVANHALWVLIHECTHNLVFLRPAWNRLLAMALNFPQVLPSAMAFTKYHRLHHTHQSQFDYDADVAAREEAELVGASRLRKLAYMAFYGFVQGAVRPSRLRQVRFWDGWIVLNCLVQVAFVAAFWWLTGWKAVLYLCLSTFFSLGLHPLGGRWIAEHYLVEEHQETNSYYGPLNRVAYNMGYHNEHHDFVQVPWSRLPRLRETAPEFYDGLFSYRSWTAALGRFIWSDRVTLFDRVVRKGRPSPPTEKPEP